MTKTLKTLFSLLLILNVLTSIAHDDKSDCKNNKQLQSLVDVDWLKQHLNDPDIIILDASVIVSFNEEGQFSMRSGKDAYDEKHIPHAGFADLLGDLSAKDTELHFVMPSPQQFQKAINNLGISNDSRVVIYSTNPSQSWSQRLWWMLKWAGHDKLAILDGGLNAWLEAGYPVSDKLVEIIKTNYNLNLRNDIIANRSDVLMAINDKSITIIDALPESSYDGSYSMYARSGHIKSAINIPTGKLHTQSGHYKPTDDLKTQFNLNPEKRIITYCGGGVAASSTAFTLHRLGYENVAVYMGSLQEWAANNDNPMSIEE